MNTKYVGSFIVIGCLMIGLLSAGNIMLRSDVAAEENQIVDAEDMDLDVVTEQGMNIVRSNFFENVGQVPESSVSYYGSIPGGWIYFAESKVTFWMDGAENSVTLSFEGADDVVPQGIGESSYRTNYLMGDRGSYTDIRGFDSVAYHDLWDGIDLVYKATPEGAKYEFRVAPNANPADIAVRYEGQDSIRIDDTTLRIGADDGILVDEGLTLFQEGRDVSGEFVSRGADIYGFCVGEYDKSAMLIIDPLVYSTYVSGSDDDIGYGIALDDSRNVYVTGETLSADFPTINGYDDVEEDTDVFVFKLSSDGSTLLYSTFIGGAGSESGKGIAVDNSGNVYVTGNTNGNFPTKNAYDSVGDSADDVFVFKLASNGSSLYYSTYVAGRLQDFGRSIAIDNSGNAYVTGETFSDDFPTVNAYNSTPNSRTSRSDVFVFKLSSTGNDLLYSTYVSGRENDVGTGIAVDDSGNVYVAGFSLSKYFPMVNPYNSTGDGSISTADVIVFKLSSTGGTLLYSTYVSGSHNDYAAGIAIDSSDNVYVTGYSSSTDFPTVNAYNDTGDGSTSSADVIVFKLSSTGNNLLYSTYISGSAYDYGKGIAIDESGNAYVIGYSGSTDFPTVNAYDDTGVVASIDTIVFKLSASGNVLLESTYMAGNHDDYGYAIVTDSWGNFYATGGTRSTDFPDLNAYNSTGDGSTGYFDAFVFCFGDNVAPDIDNPVDFPYEAGDTGNTITWTVNDDNPGQYRVDGNGTSTSWTPWVNGPIDVSVDGHDPGVFNYTVTVMDYYGNAVSDTVFVTVEDTTPPDLDSPADMIYDEEETGNSITWSASDLYPSQYRVVGNGTPTDWTSWSNGPIAVSVDGHTVGVYNYTIVVRDNYGNEVTNTVLVTVEDTTPPTLDHPGDIEYVVGEEDNVITWNPSDPNPSWFEILRDGYQLISQPWTGIPIPRNVDGLSVNVYNYTLIVTDTFGNSASDTVFVTVNPVDVDTTEPMVELSQDPEDTVTTNHNVIITATVTDLSGVDEVILSYTTNGGTTWTNVTMSYLIDDDWTATVPQQSEGVTVSYKIYASDNVGNWKVTTESSYTVQLPDTTGPSIGVSRDPLEPTELNDVVITAAVTDDSGVDQVKLEYSLDGGSSWANVTMTLSGTQWVAPISSQNIGVEVQYRVHARDNLGNWATSDDDSYIVQNSVNLIDTIILYGEIAGAFLAIVGVIGFMARRMRRGKGQNIDKSA